jgi:hypothetical protein
MEVTAKATEKEFGVAQIALRDSRKFGPRAPA